MSICYLHLEKNSISLRARVFLMLIMCIPCLHCVYLPRVNKSLDEFVTAHNNHRISTEKNKTPEQLFWCNIIMKVFCHNMPANLPHAFVPDMPNPLQDDNLQELTDFITSLSRVEARVAYCEVVHFIGQHMIGS